MTTICVIGAGHVGCALAWDAKNRGYNVILRSLPGHDGAVEHIKKNNNSLEAVGKLSGRMQIQVSRNFDEDIKFSSQEKLIVITTPSQGHESALQQLSKHDLRKATIIFVTGNGVAVEAYRRLNAAVICDSPTSPYSSRLKDGVVSFRGLKSRIQLASIPAQLSEQQKAEVSAFSSVPILWGSNTLEIFFGGLNGVVHVPTAVMNMGWIETTNGDFYFYREGMSSSVCNIINSADAERLAVASAYGLNIKSALETFNANYSATAPSMREFAQNAEAHNSTKGAQKRFLSQDVPFWLVLCSDLGRVAGVATPFIDSLILLASKMNDVDYRANGRTLEALGLGDATKEEIMQGFIGSRPIVSAAIEEKLQTTYPAKSPLQRISLLLSKRVRV